MPVKRNKQKQENKKGDANRGARIFKNQCGVCHSSSHHTVGPGLEGVVGAQIASAEGFTYSGALAARTTQKWTHENLNKWLKAPSDFVPGNAMAYSGLASQKDRSDIIAYLTTLVQ